MNKASTTSSWLLLCALLFHAVAVAQIAKPIPITGANTVNNFVNNAFSLYENTNSLKSKIKAIQQEILGKPLTAVDVNRMNAQVQSFSNFLNQMAGNASRLLALGGDVPAKTKVELRGNILLMSGALLNVGTSMKALRESEKNIQELLKTTIPEIKASLKQPGTSATTHMAKNEGSLVRQGSAVVVTTSYLTLENVPFSEVQTIADSIKRLQNVSAVAKSFNNGKAVLTVNHAGTTEQFLDAVMYSHIAKRLEVLELNATQVRMRLRQ